MQRLFMTVTLVALLFSSGCSHYRFPWVYRIDVEQGNIIDDKEKVSQLQEGMTQRQVSFLLGSPMIQDTFNQDRWDYFYSYRTGKGALTQQRITLTFSGDILTRIEKKEYEPVEIDY